MIYKLNKFKNIPIPQTEYQSNLKELSKSPIEHISRNVSFISVDPPPVSIFSLYQNVVAPFRQEKEFTKVAKHTHTHMCRHNFFNYWHEF